MIFQPQIVSEMWDTWLYHHNGTHYLYYLHKTDTTTEWDGRSVGSSLEASINWDGMSVAVSQDGVHFQEVGPIIHKRADASWMGTGSVWKAGERFILNFSETRNGVQAVFFAESADLLHWTRMEDQYRSDPDPRWYDNSSGSRWDCIWAVPLAEGGFVGYLTGSPFSHTPGIDFESIGKVTSADGVRWEATEPPVFEWGEWPRMNTGEVGAIARINDLWYLLIGGSEDQLGNRQLSNVSANNKGMYTFRSSSPHGPFKPDTEAWRLLVSRTVTSYFARFYHTPDGLLVNHHSVEHCGDEPRIWLAPLKSARVDADGHLFLGYWRGNDRLKGIPIPLDLTTGTRLYPRTASRSWEIRRTSLRAAEPNGGGVFLLPGRFDFRRGVVLEGRMEVRPEPLHWAGVGFFFELDEDRLSGMAMLAETRGRTEFGELTARRAFFELKDTAEIGIAAETITSFRLLIHRTLVELYMEDRLIQCYSLPDQPTGRVGIIFESGSAVVRGLKAWEMSL